MPLADLTSGQAVENSADFEAWRCRIRAACGRYSPEIASTETFRGWARTRSQSGFDLLDVACNVDRIDRSWADTRRDSAEYFYLILQLSGRSAMNQNERIAELWPGDIALIDSTRPSCFHYNGMTSHQISVHLPRRECGAYLGFQPEGGMKACCGKSISRLMATLFDSVEENAAKAHTSFETLLVYDLLGAAFAPANGISTSHTAHAELLFSRLRDLICRNAADPEFNSVAAAQAAGISVRYMQKLFTERGTSFTTLLEANRLERAALLLRRRRTLGTKASISDIAFSCGFVNLPHFSRTFRGHFGHAPRDHGEG